MTQNSFRHLIVSAALLVAALATAGCGSISGSIESSSKIISSPITSSSGSSSPESAYRDDVRDFTAAHVKAGGDAQTLRSEIGKLAKKHGITDWENSEATYYGVGEGLGKAGYSAVEVDAFSKVFTDNPEKVELMKKGYKSTK